MDDPRDQPDEDESPARARARRALIAELAHTRGHNAIRYASARLGDPALARELVQDALLELHRHADLPLDAARMRGFFFKTLEFKIRNAARKRQRRGQQAPALDLHLDATRSRGRLDLSEQEARVFLRQALTRLSDREVEVLHQRYREGRTLAEIAVLLRCSRSTVANVEARALRTLRELSAEPSAEPTPDPNDGAES